ncbi:tyrosine-type recombinase/integrase [Limosilactobacillus reuteri]|uniref:Integrase family protein n=1 Tax=Limosilactobacillus reuteri subsp. rodentium (strain DSM 17509 / CIP 109821 / 100-23) TaxID=349123 RepID=B3XP09_LIMR1|nr:tyrosine-type recombinase/integrase [Limosilactobacillus reuteri]EDX43545.1 integrase family protein [Limosilactobacillus reuteri subsp. rodentium]MCC4475046.1 tyrosine-type recombinase/integrase [Limosilactobacillus reuteri]
MAITSITKGKRQGCYRVRIQPTDPLTGKTVKIPSVVTKTKSEAIKIESKMWQDYKGGLAKKDNIIDKPLAIGLSEYVKKNRDNGRWESSTYYGWTYTTRLVKEYFGRQKICDVHQDDINNFAHYYVKKHNTTVGRNTTVDRQLRHLRSFFGRMMQYGLMVNPVPKSPLKEFFKKGDMTVPEKKYIFTKDETKNLKHELIRKIESVPFTHWGSRLAILIALETGMRPQEIQAVRWDELVNDHGHIVFKIDDSCLKRKGIKNINNFILLNLTDYKRSAEGLPIAQRTMNDMLKQVAKQVGVNNGSLRVSMYTCRHTVATKLGNDPKIDYRWAADRLGHTFQVFMDTYVHLDPDKDAKMLDLVSESREC